MKKLPQQQKLLLENTLGPCPTCGTIVPAKIIESDGKVFLEKECCGKETLLLENDASFYKDVYLPFRWDTKFIRVGMNRHSPEVCLKLLEETPVICFYITTHCNLDCPVCYLKLNSNRNFLNDKRFHHSINKIESFLKMFRKKYIAINGGEPTIREDLPEIIKIAKKYRHRVGVVTNGLRFSDKDYAKLIKDSGTDYICFSFDGFDDEIYKELRGAKLLKYKLKALGNLRDVGANVWLYMTVKKGLNESDIKPIIKFAAQNDFIKGITFSLLEKESDFTNRLTPSDIYKIIERDVGITVEHFKEEKKFRFLLFNLMEKIFGKNARKKFSYIKSDAFILDVSDENIKPFLTVDEYKEYNSAIKKSLDEKTNLKTVLSLIKNMRTFLNKKAMKILIPIIFSGGSIMDASIKKNSTNQFLSIKVANIIMEASEDIKRRAPIEAFGIGRLETPR